MKNIWRIYRSDLRRLTTNVVALSIVMGLAIIPSLYAWFNILSNWNPYGESATSLMKIAVYSEDQGVELAGTHFAIGDSVVESLKNNNTIDWVFADNKTEALNLIRSGECYAGIVIPEDFTENMLSIVNGTITNPKIVYYENSKKNAIATKITGKVKTTVQTEINTKIISTLTQIIAESGDYLSGNNIDGSDLVAGFEGKLSEISKSLDNYIYLIDTFSLLSESASGAIDSTKQLFPAVDNLASSSADSIGGLSDNIGVSKNLIQSSLSMMNTGLDSIVSGLDDLQFKVKDFNPGTDVINFDNSFDDSDLLNNNVLETIDNLLTEKSPKIAAAKSQFDKLKEDLKTLSSDSRLTDADIRAIKATIITDIDTCRDDITEVKELINGDLSSTLEDALTQLQSSLTQAQNILAGMPGGFNELTTTIEEYQSVLKDGTANVAVTEKYLKELKNNIDSIADDFKDITSSQKYQEIMSAIKNNPQMIVDFIASPVQMDTEAIYPIENYGSAMSPFYTVLALWVGALILVALIHVKVKDNDELTGVKPYQKFFGRYLNFFVIGQVQTLITVFGELFYVGIQCKHPVAFTLAAMMTSFVFTFLIYSLTVAFGNIGEAIAVVIMVIQVAGAGGTFPVEVLPSVYQYLYKFMPFSYCMNALRECVAGMYQHTYGKCLATLLIYVVISAVIGLLLAKPCAKLLDKLEQSKEKSGLFI